MRRNFDISYLEFLRDSATWNEYLTILSKLSVGNSEVLGNGDFFTNFIPTMYNIKEVSGINDYFIIEHTGDVYKLNIPNIGYLNLYGENCSLSVDGSFYSSYGVKIEPYSVLYVKTNDIDKAKIIIRDFIPHNVSRNFFYRFLTDILFSDLDHPFFRDVNISNRWWIDKFLSDGNKKIFYEDKKKLELKRFKLRRTKDVNLFLYQSAYEIKAGDIAKRGDEKYNITGVDENYLTFDNTSPLKKLPNVIERSYAVPGNMQKLWYFGDFDEEVAGIIRLLERVAPYRGLVVPIQNELDFEGSIIFNGVLTLPPPTLDIGNSALVVTETFNMNWRIYTQLVVSVFFYIATPPIFIEVNDGGEWIKIEDLDSDGGWKRYIFTLKKSNIGNDIVSLQIRAWSTASADVPKLEDTATLIIDKWKPNVTEKTIDEYPFNSFNFDDASGGRPITPERTGINSDNRSEDVGGVGDKIEMNNGK
jgi:hypothetical protein